MRINENEIIRIKELNGVNCAPYNKRAGDEQTAIFKLFEYAQIKRSRLHDCCGSYGGCYFVDVPNIFRDFDADENDPASYDFHYTDEYIRAIVKTGAGIVYRLGITIEWGSKKYRTYMPKDPAKWARICEHIIRHYNEGWADGYEFGIEYWEIWNEPENPPMWSDSKEDFFELYRVSATHLKACFPHIKIGGYGSSGFYAVFMDGLSDFYKSFPVWFVDFLSFVKREGLPLDFYSWHIYTENIEHLVASARYVREKLDEFGFTDTESHLNEWNYGREGKSFEDKDTMVGASFVAAAFAEMQRESVDLAQYYVASSGSIYNGLTYVRGGAFTPVAHVFHAFGEIYNAKDGGVGIDSNPSEPYAIAARDGDTLKLLISGYNKATQSFTLELPGRAIRVMGLCDAGFGEVRRAENSVTLPLSKTSVYYVEAKLF